MKKVILKNKPEPTAVIEVGSLANSKEYLCKWAARLYVLVSFQGIFHWQDIDKPWDPGNITFIDADKACEYVIGPGCDADAWQFDTLGELIDFTATLRNKNT